MCIECSGKHRLLGLHLSQIKSITMDKWTEKEIEKIQHGGNKNFKDFIESHSAYNSQWTFEERYQSQVRFIRAISYGPYGMTLIVKSAMNVAGCSNIQAFQFNFS